MAAALSKNQRIKGLCDTCSVLNSAPHIDQLAYEQSSVGLYKTALMHSCISRIVCISVRLKMSPKCVTEIKFPCGGWRCFVHVMQKLVTVAATGRADLRSAESSAVAVPRTMSSFRDRSFAAAGPRAWNKVPPPLRHVHSAVTFKRQLKAFLYNNAFNLHC